MYVKQQMRDYAKEQKISLIGELPKQKYERKGIDQQILIWYLRVKLMRTYLKTLVRRKRRYACNYKGISDISTNKDNILTHSEKEQKDVETGKMIKQIMDMFLLVNGAR